MSTRLIRQVAPTTLPVTVEEARQHCGITFSDDDVYLLGLIQAATSYLDGRNGILGRCLITQTWQLVIDRFPTGVDEYRIELPLPPHQSVSSVVYTDASGQSQTLDSSGYQVIGDDPSSLYPSPSAVWPTIEPGRMGAVGVTFVAGYGSRTDIPQSIRHALLMLVDHWYDQRAPIPSSRAEASGEIPLTVSAILEPFRVVVF